jgi:hypothetical protein
VAVVGVVVVVVTSEQPRILMLMRLHLFFLTSHPWMTVFLSQPRRRLFLTQPWVRVRAIAGDLQKRQRLGRTSARRLLLLLLLLLLPPNRHFFQLACSNEQLFYVCT